jgi:tellurite resistance protein
MLSETLRERLKTELTEKLEPLVERFDKEQIGDLVNLVVLVACADGQIDPDEREALRLAVETILGTEVAPMMVDCLVADSLEQIEASSADHRAVQVGDALARIEHTREGVRAALAVAFASEGLSDREHEILVTIARAGGLTLADRDAMIAEAKQDLAG